MRALIYHGGLTVDGAYPDPKPGPGECLMRVHLAGISEFDMAIAKGQTNFRGVPGHEFVGTVVQGSTGWRGKRVVAEINCVCCKCDRCLSGLSNHCRHRTVLGVHGRDGCMAEFVCVPERNLHAIPHSMSDEEAVFVEPLAAAYQILAQQPVEAKQRVAVVGCGVMGLLAAQVLKTRPCGLSLFGSVAKRMHVCEKRGIQTFRQDEITPEAEHDLVVECTGTVPGLILAAGLIRPRGTIVLKMPFHGTTCQSGSSVEARAASAFEAIVENEIRVLGSRCGPFSEALAALARKAVDVRDMISRVYSLDQAESAFRLASSDEAIKVLLRVRGHESITPHASGK